MTRPIWENIKDFRPVILAVLVVVGVAIGSLTAAWTANGKSWGW
jgi:hypothetical protein